MNQDLKPYFFFDLDGPILDVSEKYYRVYIDLLKSETDQLLSKDVYWEMKRDQRPVAEIMTASGVEDEDVIQRYRERRKEVIETKQYSDYDLLYENVIPVFKRLKENFRIVLCTLRSSHDNLMYELNKWEIVDYFESILYSGEQLYPRYLVKYHLIRNFTLNQIPENSWFIGDTSTDITAANKLDIKSVGVLSGIRNERLIREAEPDYLINEIGELRDIEGLNKLLTKSKSRELDS